MASQSSGSTQQVPVSRLVESLRTKVGVMSVSRLAELLRGTEGNVPVLSVSKTAELLRLGQVEKVTGVGSAGVAIMSVSKATELLRLEQSK